MIAGDDIDVTADGHRVVRRGERQEALIGRVDECIVGIGGPAVPAEIDLGLDALAPRGAGILEEAVARNLARDIDDVVAYIRSLR